MFEITTTTVSRIKHKENHAEIIEEYQSLPLEKRRKIYQVFLESSDFEKDKTHTTIIKTKRKLTNEQVKIFLMNEELERPIPLMHFLKLFNIKSKNTFHAILRKESYQDCWYDFERKTQEEKERLVSLLRELQKKNL